MVTAQPAIAALASAQPGDPSEPAVVYALPEGDGGTYPMVAVPVPGRTGALWLGRLPGRHGKLEQELEAVIEFGIEHIVCLLPAVDIADRDFYNVPDYPERVRAHLGQGFHLIEVIDYEVPREDATFERTVNEIDEALLQGKSVLVHCGAGCGRAGMFAACLMVKAGIEPLEAIRLFRRHRGCGPETSMQVAYVVRFAARLGQ